MGDPKVGLRAKLQEQQRLVGTFLMLPRVEIVEMLSDAGFDMVMIDLEHGAISHADLPALVAAAHGRGMGTIARMSDSSAARIGLALDCGVDAVMVPHVSSAAEATAAVKAARFPSEGARSLNPYTRGNRYGVDDPTLDTLNSHSGLIAMLEGAAALENLDDIIAVDGIDAFFVGPVDLSSALGYAGQPEHPDVVEAIQEIFSRIARWGKAAGLYVSTPDEASKWFDAGASFIAVSADVAMAVSAFIDYRRRTG